MSARIPFIVAFLCLGLVGIALLMPPFRWSDAWLAALFGFAAGTNLTIGILRIVEQ